MHTDFPFVKLINPQMSRGANTQTKVRVWPDDTYHSLFYLTHKDIPIHVIIIIIMYNL